MASHKQRNHRAITIVRMSVHALTGTSESKNSTSLHVRQRRVGSIKFKLKCRKFSDSFYSKEESVVTSDGWRID